MCSCIFILSLFLEHTNELVCPVLSKTPAVELNPTSHPHAGPHKGKTYGPSQTYTTASRTVTGEMFAPYDESQERRLSGAVLTLGSPSATRDSDDCDIHSEHAP